MKIIKSIQARKTAMAPICHCQVVAHRHSVLNTQAKIMEHKNMMASIQLTQSKMYLSLSWSNWNVSKMSLMVAKKMTMMAATNRKLRLVEEITVCVCVGGWVPVHINYCTHAYILADKFGYFFVFLQNGYTLVGNFAHIHTHNLPHSPQKGLNSSLNPKVVFFSIQNSNPVTVSGKFILAGKRLLTVSLELEMLPKVLLKTVSPILIICVCVCVCNQSWNCWLCAMYMVHFIRSLLLDILYYTVMHFQYAN